MGPGRSGPLVMLTISFVAMTFASLVPTVRSPTRLQSLRHEE
jgi:hypothetical protein